MKILYFVLLKLFSFVADSSNVELAQFLRFVELTKPLISPETEASMFREWGAPVDKSKMWWNMVQRSQRILRLFPRIWSSTWKSESSGILNPDCLYIVSAVNSSDHSFRFEIQQSNCQAASAKVEGFDMAGFAKGGSSFEVLAGISSYLLGNLVNVMLDRCDIIDHFNNTYSVACKSEHGRSNQRKIVDSPEISCINVTFYLDYEHFDAFADNHQVTRPMRHRLINFSTSSLITLSAGRCTELLLLLL